MALAAIEGARFREHTFELHPGDTLFVYTDGVPEATNAKNELFGTDRMLASLNRNPDAPPLALLRTVRRDLNDFVGGAPQFDDITMLGFRYIGEEGKKTEET
jgi:sigma-B regulation protein RsbU (phosphoserine phosphatase)